MASLFGALGSLAESYGLARQQLQENALAKIREQLEQRYADLAGERLNLEREQNQRQGQQFEMTQKLAQQEFGERQQEFEFRKQQAQRPQLLDFGFPIYTRPGTNERVKKLFNQTTGGWTEVPIPGTGQFGVKEIKEFIGQQDKEFQPYLTSLAQAEVSRNPDDPGKAFDKVQAVTEKMREDKAKANKKSPISKTQALAGLRALKTSVAQLENTLAVLDDKWGGYQLAGTGVGGAPSKGTEGTSMSAIAGRVLTRYAMRGMSKEQNAYIEQLNQATSQIPVLRDYFGKGTRAMAYVNALVRDLPDPTTTPNSFEGRRKINLVKQEIGIIEQTLAEEGGATGAPETSGAGGIPTVDDLLNQAFGPAPPGR